MKFQLLFFVIVANGFFYACAQKKESWKKFETDPLNSFTIPDEGKIMIDEEFGTDTVSANLIIGDAQHLPIRSSTAWLSGDTVKILIYEYNQSSSDEYLIELYKGKFKIKYDYDFDGESGSHVSRKIVTVDGLLRLNTANFKIGQEIKGYTELNGECLYGCPGNDKSQIQVKGYFKATVLNSSKVVMSVNSDYTEYEVK